MTRYRNIAIICAIVIAALCCWVILAEAATSVTLAWDKNTEPNVSGYKMYYGTAPRTYKKIIPVGNVTTYTVSDLADGVRYYFAVTAQDTFGNESGYSNEVCDKRGEARKIVRGVRQ